MQAMGAPIGAYLVTHLEPHKTQLCIAVALTVIFFLMAFKPAQARPGPMLGSGTLPYPNPTLASLTRPTLFLARRLLLLQPHDPGGLPLRRRV